MPEVRSTKWSDWCLLFLSNPPPCPRYEVRCGVAGAFYLINQQWSLTLEPPRLEKWAPGAREMIVYRDVPGGYPRLPRMKRFPKSQLFFNHFPKNWSKKWPKKTEKRVKNKLQKRVARSLGRESENIYLYPLCYLNSHFNPLSVVIPNSILSHSLLLFQSHIINQSINQSINNKLGHDDRIGALSWKSVSGKWLKKVMKKKRKIEKTCRAKPWSRFGKHLSISPLHCSFRSERSFHY